MDILKNKKQLEQDKNKLIQNIQYKLQQLRNQRRLLQQKGLNGNIIEQKNDNNNNNLLNNIQLKQSSQLSYKQFLEQKHKQPFQKQKLQKLQQIYLKKKKLQQIGVIPSSNQQVHTLYSDPKIQKRLLQYNPTLKQQKNKIIKQQMQRISFMLKKKKVNKKQISQMHEYFYKNVMKDKLDEIEKYQQLVIKNKKDKLSLLEKQEVIDLVFDCLKEFYGKVKKQIVKDFLLANQQFSNVFYITQEEIFNDLEVYETQDKLQMTRNQFYQFIKSIQISNPMLNPNMKKQQIKNTQKQSNKQMNNRNIKSSKQISSLISKQSQRQLKSYLTKLFQYFDQKNQKLIQKQKLIIALKKSLIFDIKKFNHVKKDNLLKFAEYIQKYKQNKQKQNYYKKLQGKYIGWSEIEELLDKWIKNQGKNRGNQTKSVIQSQQFQQKTVTEDQMDENSQISSQLDNERNNKDTQQIQDPYHYYQTIQKGNLQEYFDQYGWNNQSNQNNQNQTYSSELNKFDKYYKGIRQKYGNQIEWQNQIKDKLSLANNQDFKCEFNNLEAFIKDFQSKQNKQ